MMRKNKPRFRKRLDRLTPVQVQRLADLETFKIAQKHTFKELEQILTTLTVIYDAINNEKEKLRTSRIQEINEQPIEEVEPELDPLEALREVEKTSVTKSNQKVPKSQRRPSAVRIMKVFSLRPGKIQESRAGSADSFDVSSLAPDVPKQSDTKTTRKSHRGSIFRITKKFTLRKGTKDSFSDASRGYSTSMGDGVGMDDDSMSFNSSQPVQQPLKRKTRRGSAMRLPNMKNMTLGGSNIGKSLSSFNSGSKSESENELGPNLRGLKRGKRKNRRESVFRKLAFKRKPDVEADTSFLDDVDISLYSNFEIEKALEKCDRAMKTHAVFKQKQKEKWEKFEISNAEENERCFREMLSLIPEDLRLLNVETITQKTGNKYLALRLSRNKVFLLFQMDAAKLRGVHPADLENRYHFQALDLHETRALYHLSAPMRKDWRKKLRNRLHDLIERNKAGTLSPSQIRSPAYSNKPEFEEQNKKPSRRRQSVITTLKIHSLQRGQTTDLTKQVAQELQRQKQAKQSQAQGKSQAAPSTMSSVPLEMPSVEEVKPMPFKKPKAPLERLDSEMNKKQVFDFYTDGKLMSESELFLKYEETSMDDDIDERRDTLPLENGKSDGEKNNHLLREKIELDDSDDEEERFENVGTPSDNMSRRQSELLMEAFDMIANDTGEDDARFVETLRKLSTFSSTLDENDDYMLDFDADPSPPAKP